MDKGPSNQEYAALVNTAFKELEVLASDPNWQKNGEKPCDMYKLEVEGRIASKGVATVHYPLAEVVEFLSKPDTLKKLNSMLLESTILYEVKGEFKITYYHYKGIWPVSDRDIVSISTKRVEESGKRAVFISKSCNYPHPEIKDRVRGQVYIGGYIIEAIDDKTSRVTYISNADVKGSIPGMIKNTLAQKQGEIASKIQETMKADAGK